MPVLRPSSLCTAHTGHRSLHLPTSQPLYKQIYEVTTTLPAKVTTSPLYRRGYPLVAPVADPVITNFAKSKVIKSLDEHLKPKAA